MADDKSLENLQQPEPTNLSEDQWPEDAEESEKGQDASAGSVTGVTKKWPGWPGDHVFRLVISSDKVGRLIGRRGDIISKLCCETKARVKILEGVPGTSERIVMVSGKESPDMDVSPAMEAVLKVHQKLFGGLVDPEKSGTELKDPGEISQEVGDQRITTKMLVAPEHACCVIGRQGATVREIEKDSGAVVRILPLEEVPLCALSNDRMVEINGPPLNVHRALKLIISKLRKFLVDRSVLVLFQMNRAGVAVKAYSPAMCDNTQNQMGPYFGPCKEHLAPAQNLVFTNTTSTPGMGDTNLTAFGRDSMEALKFGYEDAQNRHLGVPLYGRYLSMKYSSENPPPPGITHYHDQMMHHVQAPVSHDATMTVTDSIITNMRYSSSQEPSKNMLTFQLPPRVQNPKPPLMMKTFAPPILTAQQIDQRLGAAAAPQNPSAQQIDQCFLAAAAGQGAPLSILCPVDTSFSAHASQNPFALLNRQ